MSDPAVTPLTARLRSLTATYERAADERARPGQGSWSHVVADELRRDAAQLRMVRRLAEVDPSTVHHTHAASWATAAQLDLERITRA